MKTDIPTYRAKKLNSNDYVEGFYYYDNIEEEHIIISFNMFENNIDPTTLSIHFPEMLDSKDIKIFASLREDGKGGDYTSCPELPVVFLWDKLNACICLKGKYEYTALFKNVSNSKKVSTFNKYKVIGIQK